MTLRVALVSGRPTLDLLNRGCQQAVDTERVSDALFEFVFQRTIDPNNLVKNHNQVPP